MATVGQIRPESRRSTTPADRAAGPRTAGPVEQDRELPVVGRDGRPGPATPGTVLALQGAVGNQAVQRLLTTPTGSGGGGGTQAEAWIAYAKARPKRLLRTPFGEVDRESAIELVLSGEWHPTRTTGSAPVHAKTGGGMLASARSGLERLGKRLFGGGAKSFRSKEHKKEKARRKDIRETLAKKQEVASWLPTLADLAVAQDRTGLTYARQIQAALLRPRPMTAGETATATTAEQLLEAIAVPEHEALGDFGQAIARNLTPFAAPDGDLSALPTVAKPVTAVTTPEAGGAKNVTGTSKETRAAKRGEPRIGSHRAARRWKRGVIPKAEGPEPRTWKRGVVGAGSLAGGGAKTKKVGKAEAKAKAEVKEDPRVALWKKAVADRDKLQLKTPYGEVDKAGAFELILSGEWKLKRIGEAEAKAPGIGQKLFGAARRGLKRMGDHFFKGGARSYRSKKARAATKRRKDIREAIRQKQEKESWLPTLGALTVGQNSRLKTVAEELGEVLRPGAEKVEGEKDPTRDAALAVLEKMDIGVEEVSSPDWVDRGSRALTPFSKV